MSELNGHEPSDLSHDQDADAHPPDAVEKYDPAVIDFDELADLQQPPTGIAAEDLSGLAVSDPTVVDPNDDGSSDVDGYRTEKELTQRDQAADAAGSSAVKHSTEAEATTGLDDEVKVEQVAERDGENEERNKVLDNEETSGVENTESEDFELVDAEEENDEADDTTDDGRSGDSDSDSRTADSGSDDDDGNGSGSEAPGNGEGDEQELRNELETDISVPGSLLSLLTVQQAANLLDIHKTTVAEAIHRGDLLSLRIQRPVPNIPYRCSGRYLDAVVEYRTVEEIDSASDALHEFATDEPYLPWGIRAEHVDAIRAYGPTMPIAVAEKLTGESRRTSAYNGLLIHDGQSLVVSTEGLLNREEWTHSTFEAQDHEPNPVMSYRTQEAADILGVSRREIFEMLYYKFLPSWYIDAPYNNSSGQKAHNPKHVPEPYVQALKSYYDTRRSDAPIYVASDFCQRNPNHYLRTRGQFEARADYLKARGELPDLPAVANLLGLHKRFFRNYSPMDVDQALNSVRWTPVRNSNFPRQRIVPQATREEVLREVFEGEKTLREIASNYRVTTRSINKWMKLARENRQDGPR